MTETTTTVTATYSEQMIGGIGYRVDFSTGHSYTTNQDGSGLFFHNGRGDRQQVMGNGQFSARSMRQFKAKTKDIVAGFIANR